MSVPEADTLRTPSLLAALLLLFLAVTSDALAEAPSADPAQGEAVMRSFCLSCHGKDGKNPLQPRLNPDTWGDPDQAYLNIGRLSQIQAKMDQPFTRSDEDRRALASHLARLAQENRPPIWKVALPYAMMGAGVLAAAAFFLRARRRGSSS